MGVARFFDRIYASAGGILALSRKSLDEQLGRVSVGISLDTAWTEDANARRLASFLVNLCSRLYGTLTLEGDTHWVASTAEHAKAINPEITLEHGFPSIRVVIGNAPQHEGSIYTRADGWVARVLSKATGEPPGPANPFAAAAAASLASAEIFRRAFRQHVPDLRFEDVNVSLLDFSGDAGVRETLNSASVGDVGFVGLGAVGNAAIWCLSELDTLEGRLTLVDSQAVDLSNLQRYTLVLDRDVGMLKVDLAARALAAKGTEVNPLNVPVDEAADRGVPETLVVSVDNIDGRRAVQALLPRLAINGWTSERGLGISRHYFNDGSPCLACHYHPRGDAPSQVELVGSAIGMPAKLVADMWVKALPLTGDHLDRIAKKLKCERARIEPWLGKRINELYSAVVCGEVAMDLAGGGMLEAVPLAHQSALAGIFMAAELVKQSDSKLRLRSSGDPMVVWDDVLHPAPRIWTQRRSRAPGCFCGDDMYQRAYASKWSNKA